MSKKERSKAMGSKKNNRNNDKTLAKLLIVKAIIDVLNVVITLITKLIDYISN